VILFYAQEIILNHNHQITQTSDLCYYRK